MQSMQVRGLISFNLQEMDRRRPTTNSHNNRNDEVLHASPPPKGQLYKNVKKYALSVRNNYILISPPGAIILKKTKINNASLIQFPPDSFRRMLHSACPFIE